MSTPTPPPSSWLWSSSSGQRSSKEALASQLIDRTAEQHGDPITGSIPRQCFEFRVGCQLVLAVQFSFFSRSRHRTNIGPTAIRKID